MGQENNQSGRRGEDEQGGKVDQQPGGQGVQPARDSQGFESPGFENEGHGPRDPELIDKQDSWRPTDDPVGERWDGEADDSPA